MRKSKHNEILTEQEVRDAIESIRESDYGRLWIMDRETMVAAEKALKLLLPQPVVRGDWSPDRCPTCDHDLSESLGDGYYTHPTFMDKCPECGQRLDWKGGEG